jgi:hypothetical protein
MAKKKDKIEKSVTIQTPTKNNIDEDMDTFLKDVETRANILNKEVWKPKEQEEKLENTKHLKKVIETRKELLNKFGSDNLKFDVSYKMDILKIKLNPVGGSKKHIKVLNIDFSIYTDLTPEEKEVIQKKYTDKGLNSHEQHIYDEANQKLQNSMIGDSIEHANRILSTFVSIVNSKGKSILNVKDAESFWKSFPFTLKMLIFNETMNRLGLKEEDEIKFFQVH